MLCLGLFSIGNTFTIFYIYWEDQMHKKLSYIRIDFLLWFNIILFMGLLIQLVLKGITT